MQEKILKLTEKALDGINDLTGDERTGIALLAVSVVIAGILLAVFIKIGSFLV